MAFISYAQNFEDIMLWRALKHVPNGFYIDVGANDPNVDSVTRAFYERGWRGINVEPMQQYQARLRMLRPADINLSAAVGETAGEMTLYDVPDTGLSTMDAVIAVSHAASGKTVRERQVQILRLADICREHVQGEIHFLKIDVEGFEAAVLRGMDFMQWRPWVLVIEATRPQSSIRNTAAWEALVLDAGYRLAYFDGLNDYYVADEHAELVQAFAAPPNFFDDFTLCRGHFFSFPLADLEHQVWEANVRVEEAQKQAHETHEWALLVDLAKAQAVERATLAEAEVQRTLERIEVTQAAMNRETERALRAEHYQLQAEQLQRQAEQHQQQAEQRQLQAQHLAERQAEQHRLQVEEHRLQVEEHQLQTARQLLHAEALRQQAEERRLETEARLAHVFASKSWRITRPLRIVVIAIRNPSFALQRLKALFVGQPAATSGAAMPHTPAQTSAGSVTGVAAVLAEAFTDALTETPAGAPAETLAEVPAEVLAEVLAETAAKPPADRGLPASVRLAAEQLRSAIALANPVADEGRHAHHS